MYVVARVAVRTHIDICFGDSFRHPRHDIQKIKEKILKNNFLARRTSENYFLIFFLLELKILKNFFKKVFELSTYFRKNHLLKIFLER